jgi:hypothetical protein
MKDDEKDADGTAVRQLASDQIGGALGAKCDENLTCAAGAGSLNNTG